LIIFFEHVIVGKNPTAFVLNKRNSNREPGGYMFGYVQKPLAGRKEN
jgi:hypothetical protein